MGLRFDKEVDVEKLFLLNRGRRWPAVLIRMWQRSQRGYDVEAIKWWMKQFESGVDTCLWVHRRSLEVADGNHRLIAAYYAHTPTIKVRYVR